MARYTCSTCPYTFPVDSSRVGESWPCPVCGATNAAAEEKAPRKRTAGEKTAAQVGEFVGATLSIAFTGLLCLASIALFLFSPRLAFGLLGAVAGFWAMVAAVRIGVRLAIGDCRAVFIAHPPTPAASQPVSSGSRPAPARS